MSLAGAEVELVSMMSREQRLKEKIEEIQNNGKIIRPAYINVKETKEYIDYNNR